MTSEKALSMILAVRAAGLPASIAADGFHPMGGEEIFRMLEEAGTWIGPRGALEEDAAYRQVIPYVVVTCGGAVVRYLRGASGSESRLHGRVSIGIGGHVDLADVIGKANRVDLPATLAAAADRERREELGEAAVRRSGWVGVLVDGSTEVDRVHIGIVAVHEVAQPPSAGAEEDIGELAMAKPGDLAAEAGRMERWSAHLMRALPALAAG